MHSTAPHCLTNLALAFATIERPTMAQRLVQSVRRHFPTLPIYVADQSRRIEPMRSFYETHEVDLIPMAFDSGVTASRNRLVTSIREDFFVLCDDDFVLGPNTSFEDALTILGARPDVGVVGGCLIDTSDAMYRRHWELRLQYDPAKRLLISIPIYEFLPTPEKVSDVSFYPCDAVMNFAVFRRAIFSDRIRWDERFKSNGEHEDFYLNLNVNGNSRVVYLPTMLAEHHHSSVYKNYDASLRNRADGWRRFMEKWQIDQYLELGHGSRVVGDPSRVFRSEETRSLYLLPAPALGDPGRGPSLPPAEWSESAIRALRLFFRYDPILKSDADFVLWHRIEPLQQASHHCCPLPIIVRWFDSNGQVLIWESEELVVDPCCNYWQPQLIEVPLMPAGSAWLRFEILACYDRPPVPISTGFLFPDQSRQVTDGTDTDTTSFDVLALSRIQQFEEEIPCPLQDVSTSVDGLAILPGPATIPLLLMPLERVSGSSTLVLRHWILAFGIPLASARLPSSALDAPSLIALPNCADTLTKVELFTPAGLCIPVSLPQQNTEHKHAASHLVSSRRSGVTAVLTSCGRPDLLQRTLDTFFRYNTFQLDYMIIVEDGHADANIALMQKFNDQRIKWIGTERRVGQIAAIDLAYSMVDTDMIFHLEDDWDFCAPGFIEKSMAVLQADRSCLQVWLRALDDTNGHPLEPEVEILGGMKVRKLAFDYLNEWNGFSFNPGLRRTEDYIRVGSYGRYVRFDHWDRGCAESGLSQLYRDLKMYAVILADNDGRGYVRHTGWDRTVPPPARDELAF